MLGIVTVDVDAIKAMQQAQAEGRKLCTPVTVNNTTEVIEQAPQEDQSTRPPRNAAASPQILWSR